MASRKICALLLTVALVACHVAPSMGVLLSSLKQTLVVHASPTAGEVLYAGKGKFTVSWMLNSTVTSVADNNYKSVKVMLCYAPVSRKDRSWRKASNDLTKDKACSQFQIVKEPYSSANAVAAASTFDYTITPVIPTATYFVRAYALDASGKQVAYGQTGTYFNIVGITGIHASLDIAAGVFSAFSIGALIFFFVVENKKTK